jgi:hypothetical protein
MGLVFDRRIIAWIIVSWQIWLLVQSPYKLIKLENFQIFITSSKISFGTPFKAHIVMHIVANRVARYLHLKQFGNNKNQEKVVQSVLRGTVYVLLNLVAVVCVHYNSAAALLLG